MTRFVQSAELSEVLTVRVPPVDRDFGDAEAHCHYMRRYPASDAETNPGYTERPPNRETDTIPYALKVEITESIAMIDIDSTIATLNTLTNLRE